MSYAGFISVRVPREGSIHGLLGADCTDLTPGYHSSHLKRVIHCCPGWSGWLSFTKRNIVESAWWPVDLINQFNLLTNICPSRGVFMIITVVVHTKIKKYCYHLPTLFMEIILHWSTIYYFLRDLLILRVCAVYHYDITSCCYFLHVGCATWFDLNNNNSILIKRNEIIQIRVCQSSFFFFEKNVHDETVYLTDEKNI